MRWNERKRGRDGGDGGSEEERMSVPRKTGEDSITRYSAVPIQLLSPQSSH